MAAKRYSRLFCLDLSCSVPITPKACISSATCCGISSMQSIVYHQAAGRSSPEGADEIQGRHAALDDMHDCVVMIYQACGLDKKIRQVKTCRIFWRRRKDLNLRAGYPTYTLSRGASSPLEYFSIQVWLSTCHISISTFFLFVNSFLKK